MTPSEIKLAYALVEGYEPLWVRVWREIGILRLKPLICGDFSYRDTDLGLVDHSAHISSAASVAPAVHQH
jgi:hypothetical protein